MKLHKNDEVIITKGKDKGKKGKIEEVLSKKGKVLIPEINQYKRHKKAQRQGEQSEIINVIKPLPMTNVALICPKCHKPTRVGYSFKEGSKGKVRVCRKCGKEI